MPPMASLKPRELKSGQIVYRVKWRLPGATREEVETFNPAAGPNRDLPHAKAFKAAVEAAGHRWPPHYAPGIGFVDPAQLAATQAAQRERERAANVLPFRDHAAAFLATIAPGLESGTLARYRRIVDNHLIPAFGGLDVCDPAAISPEAIGPWVTALLDGEREDPGDPAVPQADWPWAREPLSPKTVRNIHGLFYAIMQVLVDAEVPRRARNPCKDTHLPSTEDGEGDQEMVFLEPEEFARIHGEFDDPAAADFAEWLYGTGLRFSEASALQKRDFEWDGRRPGFRVRRAWKQSAGGAYYLGAPKTKASLRRVALTRRQVQLVRPYLEGRRERDLAFTGPSGARWNHSTFYTGRWRPALYRAARCVACRGGDYAAGIGRRGPSTLSAAHLVWCGHEGMLEELPRIHDLRHSHVAALIAAGAPLLAISRRLGHKSIQITYDRYGHLLGEVEDDLVAGMEAMEGRMGFAHA